jgi:hypothetical protein
MAKHSFPITPDGTAKPLALFHSRHSLITLELMTARLLNHHHLLLRCGILQLLDLLTTLLFLAHGVKEANPLVKWSMSVTNGNLTGLLAVKCVACALAFMAVQFGRPAVLVKMNRFFTVLVAWNVLALALSFFAH